MSEQDEIRARKLLKVWRGRQAFAGTSLALLLLPAIGVLMRFILKPSTSVAIALGMLLILLVIFGVRMPLAASRAVELKKFLSSLRANANVIDAEAVFFLEIPRLTCRSNGAKRWFGVAASEGIPLFLVSRPLNISQSMTSASGMPRCGRKTMVSG